MKRSRSHFLWMRTLWLAHLFLILAPTAFGATFRWASSSNRIYVEGGGSATLSQIRTALPKAPLVLVDPANKIWLLRANLMVKDGCTLLLQGSALGGDVDELRLLSNNSSAPNSFVVLDADYGTLDIRSTRVTSWNEATSAPDTEYLVYDRAFVRARSRMSGTVKQESRLNIINSEIAYLGYDDRESYGVTWQIVTLNAGLKVYGTVSGSRIHDCQLGVSTWAVDDVSWDSTEVYADTLYGFDSSNAGHRAVLASNNVHDNDYGAIFRYSAASQAIYVTGPGVATLTDVKAALPDAPLSMVDPAQLIWYAGADIIVEKGAKLKLYGPTADGDVGELRLKSENNATPHAWVEVRADYGWLDIRNTKITSWDSAVNGPDTETDTYRRAFVRARSTLDSDGVTPRESRMDVINSDIGYLGSHDAEAYGLVWKVVGAHPDPTKSIFDYVEVYGDIKGSRLHNNYFGMYSFGHQGGQWINNEVDHNIGYGFDPHDDSDNLLIADNNVHHNGWHGIIASRRCDHIVIRNNKSWANSKNGIMLHRHCDDGLIEGNQTYLNADSGIALFDTDRTLVRNNIILSNSSAGIRFSVGVSDSIVEDNEIGYSGKAGFYFYPGTDPAEADPDDPVVTNHSRRNTLRFNSVHHCNDEGIKTTDTDDNVFFGNNFVANGQVLRFTTSTGNQLVSNSIPASTIVKIAGTVASPAWLLIKKQPVIRVEFEDIYSSATLSDDGGAIFDFDEGSVCTAVDDSGSFVTLSSAQIGMTTTAVTRNLVVIVSPGGAQINPKVWDTAKVWTTKAGTTTQTLTYTVGDLTPNTPYTVSKSGSPLGIQSSDSFGKLSFSDVPGTTSPIDYSVAP